MDSHEWIGITGKLGHGSGGQIHWIPTSGFTIEYRPVAPLMGLAPYFHTSIINHKTNQMTETTTRQEHLEWCKARALQYCDVGDVTNAWASMASDMNKHPETEKHPALALGFTMMFGGMLNTPEEMARFIRGFN